MSQPHGWTSHGGFFLKILIDEDRESQRPVPEEIDEMVDPVEYVKDKIITG